MGTSFRYDQSFDFSVGRDVLWDALTVTDSFLTWWPWLRTFEVDGLGCGHRVGLTPGTVASCTVRAPLPYTLAFRVRVDQVDVGHSIDTSVSGDLQGPARLEVADAAPGSTARLMWTVELRVPMLSAASRVARPVLVWAHDRVVSMGVEQFRAHALSAPRDRG